MKKEKHYTFPVEMKKKKKALSDVCELCIS